MILYYAVGGGMGHLVRASKFATHKNWQNFVVLTAYKPEEQKVFDSSMIETIDQELVHQPSELWQYILQLLTSKNIKEFYLDTFPSGILGEIPDWKNNPISQHCNLFYVARRLNWQTYAPKVPTAFLADSEHQSPQFKASYIVEELGEQQQQFVEQNSERVEQVSLPAVSQLNSLSKPTFVKGVIDKLKNSSGEKWLIVHSGPQKEVEELMRYAEEISRLEAEGNPTQKQLFVCTMVDSLEPNGLSQSTFIQFRHYPAIELFPHFDRLFTGCGFNTMNEAKLFSGKHHFLPFPRKYDDQFLRASKARDSQ